MRGLASGAWYAVKPGVEQQISGNGQFEVQRRLLKDDAQHRQGRHRIAQHILAHDFDAARIRHKQSGKKLEQRGLASAIRTEKCNEFAGRRAKAHAVDRTDRAVGLDDIVEEQRGALALVS